VSGPAATSATRTKVLGAPLQALGMAFAKLPDAQQHEHTAQLLAAAGPLLPHLSDKALRKKLVQDPRDKLHTQHEQRDKLLEALGRIKGGAAGGLGGCGGAPVKQSVHSNWLPAGCWMYLLSVRSRKGCYRWLSIVLLSCRWCGQFHTDQQSLGHAALHGMIASP